MWRLRHSKNEREKMKITEIENEYGNVDIRFSVPEGYVYFAEQRLQTICRKLLIPYSEALIDFRGDWGERPRPVISGVVIDKSDEKLLTLAIEERQVRKAKLALSTRKKAKRRLEICLKKETPRLRHRKAEYLLEERRQEREQRRQQQEWQRRRQAWLEREDQVLLAPTPKLAHPRDDHKLSWQTCGF
jgi:Rad4/Xp-C family protein